MQIEVICKQGEKQIKEFQFNWDIEIKNLIEELKQNEDELVRLQAQESEELLAKLATE